jgi:hypothetical protein
MKYEESYNAAESAIDEIHSHAKEDVNGVYYDLSLLQQKISLMMDRLEADIMRRYHEGYLERLDRRDYLRKKN